MEIKRVQNFCKSKSKKDFDLLNLKTKNTFVKFAQFALINPYPQTYNQTPSFDIAKFILKFVNAKPIKLKPADRSKAEKLLSTFNVALTGARIGDSLVGILPVSKKAIVKIHKKDVLTQNRDLNVLRLYPDLWDKYLDRLGSLPFFSEMTKLERQLYVSLNTDEKETAIGEHEERFEILQIGNSDFSKKLTEEQLSLLISNKN
jgi:hypothetical protein